MKRDTALVRLILTRLEEAEGSIRGLRIEGHDTDEINYHLLLLEEAGLIILDTGSLSSNQRNAERLTWAGHEYLENVRSIPVRTVRK